MARVVDVLMSRAAFVIIASVAIFFFIYDLQTSILTFGWNVRCWNLPNITVTIALILALYLARQIDARMRKALHELWLQGTLPGAADPTPDLQARILRGSGRRELFSALLMMTVMLTAYAWSTAPYLPSVLEAMTSLTVPADAKRELLLSFFLPITLGIASGLVAGAFFGRLATYGSAASVLASPDTALNVHPDHFDDANGFRPLGRFYLYQAVLTAIPLLWLSGWALAISWYHSGQCYVQPVDPAYTLRVSLQLYGQWLVIAAFTYFGFVRPVLQLRRRLHRRRAELLETRVPQIESDIAQLQQRLAGMPAGEERPALEKSIGALAQERWSILTMRCWPMDRSTFSKYAPIELASNVAPLLFAPIFSMAHVQDGGQLSLSDLGSRLSGMLRYLLH